MFDINAKSKICQTQNFCLRICSDIKVLLLLYSEDMAEGGRGGLRGLQMCMDTNLRLTASELICFQELVKAGGANDEMKMSHCAGDLAAKVPSSIAFFEKILDDHLLYFKNVHPQIFQYCGTETPNQLVIAKFLMFWYVIRPFTPVAACEERFTLHSIQHAFFEFSSYIETLRVPLQVQNWTSYLSTIQHQNFQASLQQTKTQYESYSEGLKSILEVKTREYETEMKALTLKLDIKCKELQDLTFKYREKDEQDAKHLLKCEQLEHNFKVGTDENSALKEQILAILRDKAESEKRGRESQQKCETLESRNRQLSGSDAELKREIKSLKSISSALKIECASFFDEKEDFKSKFQELESKVQSLESQNASLSSILAAKKLPPPQHQNAVKDKELKTLRAEYAKSQKIISDLEEELVMFSSTSNPQCMKIKWNKKEGLDTNVEEARVLVDLCATTTKAEKILQVLQNYVVSSLREKTDEEFPAWLVVGQSILRSICSDVGLARGYLHSHYKNFSANMANAASGHALQLPRDDVFMGLLCWKVESRFRALSWLRNRVVRGFSSSGKMGNVNLQSFLDHVVEQQKIGGKITLAMGKTSPDLALEISSLNVLKRETLMLLDKNSVIPVSGAVFIPTVPASMADGVFLAVRNFALLNVCCFISLMESDSDSFKKNLLDIVFDLFDLPPDGTRKTKLKSNETKTLPSLTPDRFALAHKKVTATFSSLPDFKNFTPLLNQLGACADSFQDLYAKTFLFFDAHSSNEIDFFRKKRMLTLYNHADSLLDSFWSCQEISRHSTKVNEDLPDSLIGKIMAMEVLWNEENESIDAARKQLEALLMSLSSSSQDPASEIKCASTIDETNFFMHSLSHLIVNGKLLMHEQEKENESKEINSHSSSEDIIGYLCNEMQGCELREFITAIQESIHCFREVRKGKQVMVEGKSSLGKILQTLSSKQNSK